MKLRNKKTGEIIDPKRQVMALIVVRTDDREVDGFSSIAELSKYWEDYQPAEPLIKDEKIRKAVRAWAEACGTKTVEITHSRPHMLRIMDATDDDEICFNREIGQVFDEIIYNNIAELCGEEE